MFHIIPEEIQGRMEYLELVDHQDREDGTPRMERLRQVPPETGRFLALWAASAAPGIWLEVGTSAGYSTLWLSLAARTRGERIITFELLPEKAALARETFRIANVGDMVELVEGDAREYLPSYSPVGFCFLDTEKEIYLDCYEQVVPNMVPGSLLLADNAINHQEALQPFLSRVMSDPRVDSLIVPIGKGVLVARCV